MARTLFEGRFHLTYFYAGTVHSVVSDPFGHVDIFDDYYGDDDGMRLTAPFPRESALHDFIGYLVDRINRDDYGQNDLARRQQLARNFAGMKAALKDLEPSVFPLNEELLAYGIEHESFADYLRAHGSRFVDASEDDLYDYHEELWVSDGYARLVERVVEEVFFLIFQNRGLLRGFNGMIASRIASRSLEEVPDDVRGRFARHGRLRRCGIPQWVRRAVFFRDRGMCTVCHADVSGTRSIGGKAEYDHIVPLANGGLNDVTNIQLLCMRCNRSKRHLSSDTGVHYEAWYPLRLR